MEALERAGAEVTTASRREAGWPPSAEGYDILVNATPVKDEVIVAPHAGMEVVDLAYLPDGRDTALIAAAARPAATSSSTVSTCSSSRGSRVRALDGLAAPLVAMREALRGS